ncbi:helix-turn-helix transcriptional regulator [Lactobacillus kefiranofaciens subsp. kefirgranum]|uniref:helix-turn-helix domain-containing protein n=1 Tax=Lactobacillus kefiranofaciens TaxID=267818 RepID=UPI00202F6642|nr:helix-turn-helix transcriptional regulator [Lactobacillus kefiranofaciens]MDF4142314.1 helix-turn-helix transcriptional regulator [Lactobacillus kefiranofaciens]URW72294.1 helix-turn-helix transcriptional regulator [Lactobacillus kefiranofaciens subsp. kefirgranum]URW74225.1 helix-turn-helix transcriptional regulator [Lactobacillus kefiranofaciens subsp. kefirgranum]
MNRIKELRQENKFSQIELANKVHASNQAISAYESGTREPKEPMWQALANFFNVSVDYLKGYGYSKDYIYKLLDDAYKEDYPLTFELEPPFTNTFISARDEIENYCKQNKISIPKDTDLDFWKTNFNFIFKDKSVKRLLTTKDSYSDDDIKEIIINAIYWYGLNPHTRELVNKLNHKS